MSLVGAADGLYAGVATGVFALAAALMARRSERPFRRSSWQRQAERLRSELRAANDERVAYLESRIRDLRGDLERKDTDLAQAYAEIRRLNRLLVRQRNGGGYDRA